MVLQAVITFVLPKLLGVFSTLIKFLFAFFVLILLILTFLAPDQLSFLFSAIANGAEIKNVIRPYTLHMAQKWNLTDLFIANEMVNSTSTKSFWTFLKFW